MGFGGGLLIVALLIAAGPLSFLSITCLSGCGGAATTNVILPAASSCPATGSACSIQGQYTFDGAGSSGSNLQYSLAYTGQSTTTGETTTSNSDGFFTILLSPQPVGTTGLIKIKIPASNLYAEDTVTWTAPPSSQTTYSVQVNYANTPVGGATVTIYGLTGDTISVGGTNNQGTATFLLPTENGYTVAVQDACSVGSPLSATASFANNADSVTVNLPGQCTVTTTTMVSTVTSGSSTTTTTIVTTVASTTASTTTQSQSSTAQSTQASSSSTTSPPPNNSGAPTNYVVIILGITGVAFVAVGGVEEVREH